MQSIFKNINWFRFIFWALLVYILASQFFWFISLIKLNEEMIDLKIFALDSNSPSYFESLAYLEKMKRLKVAQYLGEGGFVLLIILGGAAYLYRTFNKRIKEVRQEANFLMAITHELKTPIAITKLNLETILRRNLDGELRKRLLQNSLNETNRLAMLSNNLLVSSQIESGKYLQSADAINYSELVEKSVYQYANRYPDRVIDFEGEDDMAIKGDINLLEMMVHNLIENALKYSATEQPVKVTLHKQLGDAVLMVADNGTGIPDEEKKRIFQKHYRIGNEATKKAKGTGLGLYLVQRIVQNYHGKVRIENNTPQGCIFIVNLKMME